MTNLLTCVESSAYGTGHPKSLSVGSEVGLIVGDLVGLVGDTVGKTVG